MRHSLRLTLLLLLGLILNPARLSGQFGLATPFRCDPPGGMLEWDRQIARLMESLGDEATNKAFDGALRLTDVMAPLNEGALVDDLLRLDELAETFVKSSTPGPRKLLRESAAKTYKLGKNFSSSFKKKILLKRDTEDILPYPLAKKDQPNQRSFKQTL